MTKSWKNLCCIEGVILALAVLSVLTIAVVFICEECRNKVGKTINKTHK